MRCATHVLNLVLKDGLSEVNVSILRIRCAVKYVRSSPTRLAQFKTCVVEEGMHSKSLVCLDIDTRWNSTYLMLESALKFRKAFDKLGSKGGQYVKEFRKCGGSSKDGDWNNIVGILPFLGIFYEATLKISGCLYVTGNCYVSEIYGVRFLISDLCNNNDDNIRNIAQKMKLKYDKYWENVDNINILLFIALVLDPRHK